MDLLLIVLSLVLATLLLVVPLSPDIAQLMQISLVALLALLLLLRLVQLRRPKAQPEVRSAPAQKPAPPAPAPPAPEALVEAGVVQFLARLQEKGRLVDYLMDDIAPYSDEQIGVVARVVHQGCREVLRGAFEIVPVHGGKEREEILLAGDFDAASYRLVGKVPDHPPYRGTVLHPGWKAARVTLPRLTEAAGDSAARKIIAPAEVEVGEPLEV